ncbi:MAG: methionyl-tRNA synthetase, partial [Edafosvirus sp.]
MTKEESKVDIPIIITSALPYCNNIPHLGNIIGSVLSADIFARFCRLKGKKVRYICGVDEYGTATEVKAKEEGLTCEELCNKYIPIHKNVYEWFNISFDDFGRTTTDTHTREVQDTFKKLYENKHIEEKEIDQLYCKTCDTILADRYIKGLCYHPKCTGKGIIANGDQCDICGNLINALKLVKPYCHICQTEPIIKKSTHFYLKLGDFAEQLGNYFD